MILRKVWIGIVPVRGAPRKYGSAEEAYAARLEANKRWRVRKAKKEKWKMKKRKVGWKWQGGKGVVVELG